MTKYYNASLRNLTYRLRRFKAVLDQELAEEIRSHEHIIIDMIHRQLYSGLDGYKHSIQPPYAWRTIRRKLKKGQPTDRVTLYDTGDFYKSLSLVFDEDGFYVTSSNQNLLNILVNRYGSPILRLSDENMSILMKEYIRPSLQEKLKNFMENG